MDEGAERDGVAGLEEDSGALVDLGVCEVGPRQRQPHLMIQLGEVFEVIRGGYYPPPSPSP